MRYARDTEVSSERSRAEIERTLVRYGATGFAYGWQHGGAVIGFQMNNRTLKFLLPLPDKNARKFTHYRHSSGQELPRAENVRESFWEQACRQRWRALSLIIKAKLEAVECGISVFEEEFLANIVLPDGSTFGKWAVPQIEQAYSGKKMPPLLTAAKGAQS